MKYRFALAVVLSAVLMACSTPPSAPRDASGVHYDSSAQALADGFALTQEVNGPAAQVARIYTGAQGRRLLVLGERRASGFQETGWGFVLPCEHCGFDLPPSENLSVSWSGPALHIRDRSLSMESGVETDALLVLRFTPEKQQWRLARVEQHSKFHKKGTAEKAIIDYDLGYSYDATGRLADGQWVVASSQEDRAQRRHLPIHELNLY
ncbi:MAG: hypothetical protein M0Q54_02205 [Pigmentiphaga sp.]|nr:hypothetical protein [Pigmentiphaga sp.]